MFNYDFDKLKIGTYVNDMNLLKNEIREICKFVDSLQDGEVLYKDIIQNVDRVEYSIGGYTLNRGFYSTNFYEILTVEGCNRGKLIKNRKKGQRLSYKFCYINNILSIVKKYHDSKKNEICHIEFIEKKAEIEVGVIFDVFNETIGEVSSVNISQYQKGKLVCERCLTGIDADTYEYEINWYTYEEDFLKEIKHLDFFNIIELLREEIVLILYDYNGLPTQFILNDKSYCTNYISENAQKHFRDMHRYIGSNSECGEKCRHEI